MSEHTVEELMARVEELETQNAELLQQLENRKLGDGRKMQVLELLKNEGKMTIAQISKALGISTKNVSSQLTYLRTDGYHVCTDHQGFKFLLDD